MVYDHHDASNKYMISSRIDSYPSETNADIGLIASVMTARTRQAQGSSGTQPGATRWGQILQSNSVADHPVQLAIVTTSISYVVTWPSTNWSKRKGTSWPSTLKRLCRITECRMTDHFLNYWLLHAGENCCDCSLNLNRASTKLPLTN